MSIILDKISKGFDGKTVISDFSFSFPDTGRYCLTGPSGCGKTTLLRMIAGMEKPDTGSIRREGGSRIGMQFQEDRLLPWFTVRRNLSLVMDPERVRNALNAVGLEDAAEKTPNELSGGMKRRISLIRALYCRSDIVLLDEPVREVDPENADVMLKLIRQETEGKLLITVSHEIRHAEILGCGIIQLGKKDEDNER